MNYVAVDFTRDDLLTCLKSSSYNPLLPTVFTLEGVVPYLDKSSAMETLSFVRDHLGPRSSLMFDYVHAAALDGRMQSRVIRHINSLKFIFNEPILY